MKIFTNKNLIQKVIISFVCVILLNFCMVPKVEASWGGDLMGAMRDFVTALADVTISVVQFGVTGEWTYAVDNKNTGITNGNAYWIDNDKFRYPIIQISPELIFGNQIELLNIDFIGGDSGDSYILEANNSEGIHKLRTIIASWYVTLRTIAIVGLLSVLIYIGIRIIISSTSQDRAKYKQRLLDWIVAFCLLFFMHYIMAVTVNIVNKVDDMLATSTGIGQGIPLNLDYGKVVYNPRGSYKFDDRDMVVQKVGNWLKNKGIELKNGNPDAETIGGSTDRFWHFYIDDGDDNDRNDVEVLQLSYSFSWGYQIPLYIGSKEGMTEQEITDELDELKSILGLELDGQSYKYKYREELVRQITNYLNSEGYDVEEPEEESYGQDRKCWQFIESDETLLLLVYSSSSGFSIDADVYGKVLMDQQAEINAIIERIDDENAEGGYIEDVSSETELWPDLSIANSESGKDVYVATEAVTENDGSKILYFINYARLYLNVVDDDQYIPIATGFLIIYIVLIVFTVMFTIRYMKRVIYVAFLTLMAPLVSLTYPIDKIKDRKSTSI